MAKIVTYIQGVYIIGSILADAGHFHDTNFIFTFVRKYAPVF
jgi:hypothetical protein